MNPNVGVFEDLYKTWQKYVILHDFRCPFGHSGICGNHGICFLRRLTHPVGTAAQESGQPDGGALPVTASIESGSKIALCV
jgi:hypothetical protein